MERPLYRFKPLRLVCVLAIACTLLLSCGLTAFAAEEGSTDKPATEPAQTPTAESIVEQSETGDTAEEATTEPAAPAVSVEVKNVLYPADVQTVIEGSGRRIVKTYTLTADKRPADIPRDSFELNGWRYDITDITQKKTSGTDTGQHTGTVNLPSVAPGWYVVHETKAPTGYTLDSTAKTVEVKPVVPSVVTFSNKPLSGIEIIKTDSVTHNPLAGATFVVERSNGERIGSYKTDAAGKIIVPDLTEGTYVVSETIAPDGYHLNETPKTAVVVSGKLTTVEFTNKPFSGIQVIKLDAITNAPLSGATSTIERDQRQEVFNKSLKGISL